MKISLSHILEAMNWRYAVKKFDVSKKVSSKDLDALLEVARLSPSSMGLQPYKIVVVENKAARKLILAAASTQTKIVESSYLLVFCTYKKFTKQWVNSYIDLFAKERKLSTEQVANLRKSRHAFISETSAKDLEQWASNQAYIGFGVLLEAAALSKIDACPMGGFKPKELDKVLNLNKFNLQSTVLCALGYRAKDDKESKQVKVRKPKSEFIVKIK